MFPLRPLPGDRDEDLLAFQEQFMASGQKASAKVIRCSKQPEPPSSQLPRPANELRDVVSLDGPSVKEYASLAFKDPFQNRRQKVQIREQHTPEDKMDQCDTHITKVLADIVRERNTTSVPVKFPAPRTQAFPSAFKRSSEYNSPEGKKVSKSIFAQQFKKHISKNISAVNTASSPAEFHQPAEQQLSKIALQTLYPDSRLVSGKLKNEIHEENIEKLSMMSEAEVLEQQSQVQKTLDPKLIEFIKMRKSADSKTSMKEEIFMDELSKQVDLKPEQVEMNMEVDDTGTDHLINVDRSWVHMDDVEHDKTRWMRGVKQTTQRNKIDLPHRFDFEGSLLSVDVSDRLPTHLGLHHHGDEPNMGGYTLQELLDLTRSEFMQQRVLALRILSKIIYKDKRGQYAEKLPNVIPILVDAGIVFVIRWALDERSENCTYAAVDALWSLLVPSKAEDTFNDAYFLSAHGCMRSSFRPQTGNLKDKEDFELAKEDLILSFVKVDVLPRIRYILEVCQPEQQAVLKCLEVLQRICLHSVDCATKVLECPRLILFVIKQYLPASWLMPATGESSQPVMPLPQAIQLIRVICQSGRHACARVIQDNQNVVKLLQRFVASVGGISSQESTSSTTFQAELECLKLWSVCASYGYLLPQFRNVGPSVILQLQFCIKLLDGGSSVGELLWVEHFVRFVSCVMSSVSQQKSENASIGVNERRGIFELIKTIVRQVCAILKSQNAEEKKKYEPSILGIASVGLDAMATHYDDLHRSATVNAVDLSTEIENEVLPTIIGHDVIIARCASLQMPALPECPRFPFIRDLALNAIPPDSVTELTRYIIAQRFLSSYVRCIASLCRCCKTCCTNISSLVQAASCIGSSQTMPSSLSHSILSRISCDTLYWTVKLFVIVLPHAQDLLVYAPTFHTMALRCMSMLSSGDEHRAHDLLSTVLFNIDMFSDSSNYNDAYLTEACKNLPAIRAMYMTSLSVDPKRLVRSEAWYKYKSESISSFFLPSDQSQLLPADWPFLPLVHLYDIHVHQGDIGNQAFTNFTTNTVLTCLNHIYLLEVMRPPVLQHVLPLEAKLTRLMCVFMAGSDVFLEQSVQNLLRLLFQNYCNSGHHPDFARPISGLTSFYDFYTSLLEQFEAVSYGDHLFAAVLLLPLCTSPKYRIALWSDHVDALRVISLKRDQLLVAPEVYFAHGEASYDVVRSYTFALMRGCCQPQRNPFLYHLAVHHIASFIFKQAPDVNTTARKSIVNLISSAKNETFRQHVFHYQESSPISGDMVVAEQCPESNQLLLRHLLDDSR